MGELMYNFFSARLSYNDITTYFGLNAINLVKNILTIIHDVVTKKYNISTNYGILISCHYFKSQYVIDVVAIKVDKLNNLLDELLLVNNITSSKKFKSCCDENFPVNRFCE